MNLPWTINLCRPSRCHHRKESSMKRKWTRKSSNAENDEKTRRMDQALESVLFTMTGGSHE